MLLVIDIALIVMLLGICIQDIKSRQVYLWFFILTLILMIGRFIYINGSLSNILLNASFISMQIAGVFTYSMVKKRLSIQKMIGVGDFFMWGILIFGFSPLNFIVFFITSSMTSLLLNWLLLFNNTKHIPLAGLQSLCFLFVIVLNKYGLINDLYSDYFWMNLLVQF